MAELLGNRVWQLLALVFGAILLITGFSLPSLIEPDEAIRMAKLETEGVRAQATVTHVTVAQEQAARKPSFFGTYLFVRGLGGSRKLAAGSALLARSAAKSEARARANGPAWHEIEYEIPLADGQHVAASDRVMLPRGNLLDVGTELTVLHDRADPGIHRLPHFSKPTERVSPGLKYGPAGLSVLLGAFLVWFGLQKPEAPRGSTYAALASASAPGLDAVDMRYARPAAMSAREMAARESAPAAARPARRGSIERSPGAPRGFGHRARA